jgi:hypothetical protein
MQRSPRIPSRTAEALAAIGGLLLAACSHERAAPVARAEATAASTSSSVPAAPPSTSTPPPAAAAPSATGADAGALASAAEPKSTALRCGEHPFEIGREWIETIDETEKPHGTQVGCYLFGTAETTKSSVRLQKKILAISGGHVTKVRIKYLSDSAPPGEKLEGVTATVDLTADPPRVEGAERKHEARIGADAQASFVAWPKSDDAKELERAFTTWRHMEPAGEMRKVKTKVSKAAVAGAFPAARGFSAINDTNEESAGMCHSGESTAHLTGTVSVVDEVLVVDAQLTTAQKATEGTCQGCGPRNERPCPHVRCKDSLQTYTLHVQCEP